MSLPFVDNAAVSPTARAASASSSDDDEVSSRAAFSSCMSVRSRSSTIATTRSQSYAFHDEFERGDHGLHFEDPERENFYVLAPSQTTVTASPRTESELEDCQQTSEGDGQGKDEERRRRYSESGGPPVPEVRIPLSAVARQGLVELSRDDWKRLYLSTSKSLEVMRAHMHVTHDENRKLKRKLIEMQKTLFEARRNRSQHLLRSVPDHLYPWSIPDSRRSLGKSTAESTITCSTTTTNTRTATGTASVVVTSTASEEDSSDGGPQLSYMPQHNHHHYDGQQERRPEATVLLPSPRPCKVPRRDSSPTARTRVSAAAAYPGTS